MSPRNIPILKIKIDDGTTNWRENRSFIFYDIKKEAKLIYAMKHNLYVKLPCMTKITGLVYKTEIQITALMVKLVDNFNEITKHCMTCIKAST